MRTILDKLGLNAGRSAVYATIILLVIWLGYLEARFVSLVFDRLYTNKKLEQIQNEPKEMFADANPQSNQGGSGYRDVLDKNIFMAEIKLDNESTPLEISNNTSSDDVNVSGDIEQEVEIVTSMPNINIVGLIEGGDGLAILTVQNVLSMVTSGDIVEGYKVGHITRQWLDLSKESKIFRLTIDFGKLAIAGEKEKLASDTSRPPNKPAEEIVPAKEGETQVISRKLINDMLMNPYDLLSKVRLVPFMQNGQPVGFKVKHVQGDNVLAKLGVKNNDVVKSINGINIKDMNDATSAIQSLMTSETISVTVLRGGKDVNLDYAVR